MNLLQTEGGQLTLEHLFVISLEFLHLNLKKELIT